MHSAAVAPSLLTQYILGRNRHGSNLAKTSEPVAVVQTRTWPCRAVAVAVVRAVSFVHCSFFFFFLNTERAQKDPELLLFKELDSTTCKQTSKQLGITDKSLNLAKRAPYRKGSGPIIAGAGDAPLGPARSVPLRHRLHHEA